MRGRLGEGTRPAGTRAVRSGTIVAGATRARTILTGPVVARAIGTWTIGPRTIVSRAIVAGAAGTWTILSRTIVARTTGTRTILPGSIVPGLLVIALHRIARLGGTGITGSSFGALPPATGARRA